MNSNDISFIKFVKYPYYDYKKDFPKGNGWEKSFWGSYSYNGEIIDSTQYVFKKGKYEGMTLQYIADMCWRGIIKYIDYGLIFITKECLAQLQCGKSKLAAIRAANDSKLDFCRVFSIEDELYTKPFSCSYQGQSFREIAESDPHYLIKVIERGFFPTYGKNQRFYAEDRSSSLYNDEEGLRKLLENLKWKGVAEKFTSLLEKTIKRMEEQIEEENAQMQAYIESQWEEEERRYFENEGYWAAFEGDPDAEWNID